MSSSSPKKLPAPTAQQPRTTAAERVVAAVAATTTKAKATTTTERSLAAEAAAIVQATKHKQASSSSSPAATTTTTTAAAKAATMTATTTQRRSTTTSTTTRTTASSSPSFHFHFPNFSEMVYQLLCFRCQHGHCDVPATEKPLGHWVEFVRSVYRKKRKDDAKAAYLTTERIQVLNSIGFTWASSSSSAGSGSGSSPTMQQERNDKLWEKHYQNLLAFKKEHGHCNVPQKTPLGRFVKNQRHQYKQRQLQLTTSTPLRGVMPTERFKKLQAIGFTWSVQPTKVTWEERFEELVEFKKRFGHTNVVQGWKENVPLGRWVMKQRVYYNQRLRGEKHLLTDERMAKLNEIGFLWVGQNYKGSAAASSPSRKRKDPQEEEEEQVHPSSSSSSSPPNSRAHSYGYQQWNNKHRRTGSDGSLSARSEEYGAL